MNDVLRVASGATVGYLGEVVSSLHWRVSARVHEGTHPDRALDDFARLVRDVRLARESMTTYRSLDRFLIRRGEIGELRRLRPMAPKRVLMFVGYSRSGHSLVGSLLDAHPRVVVSHELHLLKHLRRGVPFPEICRAVGYNSWLFNRDGRSYTGYDYRVPGQHQGSSSNVTVVGDKKGNGTARLLRRHPELIARLPDLLPVPFSFVHVIRNPFDNIATRSLRTGASLRRAADGYFANAKLVESLRARHPQAVVDVHLDDLVECPRSTLSGLLRQLGITQKSYAYLNACAAIVYDRPSRSRDRVRWDPGLVRELNRAITALPLLHRYLDGAVSVDRKRSRGFG